MVDNSVPKPTGNMTNIEPNPLMKHIRQPKIYIKLPSGGKYWPDGAVEIPETGELPVLPMTARDEITFKTPDALINGQATVDVIQSCIPSIKNAWEIPSIDLDVILIAIRRASYGDTLEMSHKIPGTDIQKDYGLDLVGIYVILQNTLKIHSRLTDLLFRSNQFRTRSLQRMLLERLKNRE